MKEQKQIDDVLMKCFNSACMERLVDVDEAKRNLFGPYKIEICGLCLPRPW